MNTIYTSYAESRQATFKAWYKPDSDWSIIFDSSIVHNEIANKHFKMSEYDALKNGYYRIYVYKNTVNIDSQSLPNSNEFCNTKEFISKNIFVNKLSYAIWEIEDTSKYYKFPKQSFLFADGL